jgi:glutamate-1-semialdehyde 2,1-aminomutase
MTTLGAFQEIFHRIPGGCSTAAKSPLRSPARGGPYFATAAAGGHFTDEEGREWLDFDMALSAAVLGYTFSKVDEAVIQQIKKGFVFSIPSPLEAELAERLSSRFSAAESLRFCKDGSDATTASVRIARSATGRSKIVAASYHGWHDWSAIHYYREQGFDCRQLGIPKAVERDTLWLSSETFAQGEEVMSSHSDIAGIIVCPENWPEKDLRLLTDDCRKKGVLLIFDEIKSGIRYSSHGVAGEIAAEPDLICLGKSLANGFPLAALGGKTELMTLCTDINFSTTAASEGASMAAALAVDDHLSATARWPPWKDYCQGIIARLTTLLSAAPSERRLAITGYPGNFRVHVPGCSLRSDPFRNVLLTTLARHGILSMGYLAPCAAHTDEDFAHLETALTEAIERWCNGGSAEANEVRG